MNSNKQHKLNANFDNWQRNKKLTVAGGHGSCETNGSSLKMAKKC